PFKSFYIGPREGSGVVGLGVFGPLKLVYAPPLSWRHAPKLARGNLPAAYRYVVKGAPIYALRRRVVLGLATFPALGRAGKAATTTAWAMLEIAPGSPWIISAYTSSPVTFTPAVCSITATAVAT